tara:strand:- start:637 stop:867 length:231 start_codon:yes stop_codon:yes gene_type:complete
MGVITGVITDLESLCNGAVQSVDQSARLINEMVQSGKLEPPSIEEMRKALHLLDTVRSSISCFQHGMAFEKRFEEF